LTIPRLLQIFLCVDVIFLIYETKKLAGARPPFGVSEMEDTTY
jgi:hypothetical protein